MRGMLRQLTAIITSVLFSTAAIGGALNPNFPPIVTTPNSSNLVPGFSIVSGYTGDIANGSTLLTWGQQIYQGNSCNTQMYEVFAPTRGFASGLSICGTETAGSTTTQYIGGFFGVDGAGSYAIATVMNAVAAANNVGRLPINTVAQDNITVGYSTASSISGTTLTVGGSITGTFNVGDWVLGTGVTAGSYIVSLGTGTGGAGTYNLNYSSTTGTTAISDHKFLNTIVVQNEYDSFCVQPDTRCRNIIDGFFTVKESSIEGLTVSGAAVGATIATQITGTTLAGSPGTTSPSYTLVGGDNDTKAAAGLAAAINANSTLAAAGYIGKSSGNVVSVYFPTNNGTLANTVSFATSVTGGAGTLTPALISSGNDQRFGQGCVLFSSATAPWQDCFISGNGSSDFSLVNGLSTATASATGTPSQAQKWYYTDNTSSSAIRAATIKADPTNSGSTGVDIVFGNNSSQNTNIAASGGLKAGTTKNVADANGNAVHQITMSRAGSVTANATTCSSVYGNQTAGTCGNGQWMVANQAMQISNLFVEVPSGGPGAGNSIAVTLEFPGGDQALTCTISNTATSCSDTSDKVAMIQGQQFFWKYVNSASSTATTVFVSASLDNPAP